MKKTAINCFGIIVALIFISINSFSQRKKVTQQVTKDSLKHKVNMKSSSGSKTNVVVIGTVNGPVTINKINNGDQAKKFSCLFKIYVNTYSKFFVDGTNKGFVSVTEPLKVQFHSKGKFRLKIASIHYPDQILDKEVVIDENLNGKEEVICFTFEISNDLIPIRPVVGGKFCYLNVKTKELPFNSVFDYAEPFNTGLAVVGIGKKKGYINCGGEVAIPINFEDAKPFKDFSSIITTGGLQGIIDTSGKIIIPPSFNNLEFCSGGGVLAIKNEKMGYWYSDPYSGIPAIYSYIIPENHYRPYYFKVAIGGRHVTVVGGDVPYYEQVDAQWGVTDVTGKSILPPKFDEINFEGETFGERLFACRKGNLWQLFDGSGNKIGKSNYEQAITTGKGFLVQHGKVWKFIDHFGNVVVSSDEKIEALQPDYQVNSYWKATNPNSKAELLAVYRHGKAALFDLYGKQLSDYKYDAFHNVHLFIVEAEINNKIGYILNDFVDHAVKEVTPFIYEKYHYPDFTPACLYGIRVIKTGEKYGAINTFGGWKVLSAIYDDIVDYQFAGEKNLDHDYTFATLFGVKKNGKYAVFDTHGQQLTNYIFDHVEKGGGSQKGYLTKVMQNGLNGFCGFVDTSGIIKVPIKYTKGRYYYNSTVEVEINGKNSYYNISGLLFNSE